MYPDKSIERWDEYNKIAQNGEANRETVTANYYSPLGGIFSLYGIIRSALVLYEGYHINSYGDPWVIHLPLALTIREGMKIYNTSRSGEEYVIDKVIRDLYEDIPNAVRIRGSEPPRPTDRLILDEAERIEFFNARPRSVATNVDFQSSADITRDNTAALRPQIAYSVIRSEPASMEGRPFGDSMRERKPRLRGTYKDPRHPEVQLEKLAQYFESLVQFDINTRTDIEADIVTRWLSEFMQRNNWVFRRQLGIERVMFWERAKDNIQPITNTDSEYRGLVYYVRTEEIYDIFSYRPLNHLSVNAYAGTIQATGSVTPTGEPIVVTVYDS